MLKIWRGQDSAASSADAVKRLDNPHGRFATVVMDEAICYVVVSNRDVEIIEVTIFNEGYSLYIIPKRVTILGGGGR